VVEFDWLAALDGLIWLRTGHQVEAVLGISQSTVSRVSRKCAEVFGVSLVRRGPDWHIKGDETILNLERRVHQVVRWSRGGDLRLEAQHWSGPLLCSPAPAGWITGFFHFQEYERPLQLLRDGVIDAWLASYPDLPAATDPTIACIALNRMPMWLVVQQSHPLLELGEQVTFDDVTGYQCLPLPDGAFPKFQAVLEACGLWNSGTSDRIRNSSWFGQANSEDLMVGFATPLSLPLYGDSYRVLPLELPVQVGDALLVPRQYEHAPQTLQLLADLRRRLELLASTAPDMVLLDGVKQPWAAAETRSLT
jgi:DNA-binding transcriptional LysR family regulator